MKGNWHIIHLFNLMQSFTFTNSLRILVFTSFASVPGRSVTRAAANRKVMSIFIVELCCREMVPVCSPGLLVFIGGCSVTKCGGQLF